MMATQARRQVLVIGLDGATYRVIDPLLAAGELPVLARLLNEGVRGELRSTLPPNSAPAWSSFLTGVNPARHRILDFREVDLRRYEVFTGRFINARALAGRTILDWIGTRSRGVVAYRVPMTYPVWPVNGVLVAGYPTPDRKRAYTYPPELANVLTPLALHSHDEIMVAGIGEERRNADHEIARLLAHMGRWLRENRHDFYVAVTGITDGFHHKFWKYHDPQHPLHDPGWPAEAKNIIREYYRRLDAAIGELLACVDHRWLVVVMSDHGGGPRPWRQFHVNAWLARQGWLTPSGGGRASWTRRAVRYTLEWARHRVPWRRWLAEHLPVRWQQQALRWRQATGWIDWSRTQAYHVPLQYPAGGIEINLRGRQPQGVVAPGAEYERLRDEIIAALKNVRDPETDRPVIVEAWPREAVYPRGDMDSVPDILFLTSETFDCGSDLDHVFSTVPLSFLERINGDHTMEGIAVFWGEGVRRGCTVHLDLLDLPPTLIWAMGLPLPADMDGKVLTEVFTPAYVAAHPVTHSEVPLWQEGEGAALSPAEEEAIRKALVGLGYLEE